MYDVTRPASLSGEGRLQLLTVLCQTSKSLGLDFPRVLHNGAPVEIRKLLGEGATSRVYLARLPSSGLDGALKILSEGYEDRAQPEYNVRQILETGGVNHNGSQSMETIAPAAEGQEEGVGGRNGMLQVDGSGVVHLLHIYFAG